jgi:hypothetical protein
VKSAGFYMSIVASVIALSLAMAWMNRNMDYLYAAQNPNAYRAWINVALYGVKVIVTLAPVSMMIYFRENTWVRNLFLFTAVTVLIIAAYGMAYVVHVRHAATPTSGLRILVTLFTFAGIITFVGACFSVQTPRFRTGFRWLAILYLMEFLGIFIWSAAHAAHLRYISSYSVPYLFPIPAYILLLVLCYRAGESTPPQDQWEAAVDSIGSPEEDSAN